MSSRDDQSLERLLRLAGPRLKAPDATRERVFAAVRSEWRNELRRRERRRWAVSAVAAAVVLLTLAVGLRDGRDLVSRPSPEVVGSFVIVAETVETETADGLRAAASVGSVVRTGDVVRTTGRGAALRLANGTSARLDLNTSLRAADRGRLELLAGAIYIDSDQRESSGGLVVTAGDVAVREIGTQFEVRREGDATRVRVREGRVVSAWKGSTREVERGEELLIPANGLPAMRTIAPADPSWSWAVNLAPAVQIEGRSLERYLQWVGRETGRDVRFEASGSEPRAVLLHGSIAGMTPSESLDAVLPVCDLTYRIEGDEIVIERTVEGSR